MTQPSPHRRAANSRGANQGQGPLAQASPPSSLNQPTASFIAAAWAFISVAAVASSWARALSSAAVAQTRGLADSSVRPTELSSYRWSGRPARVESSVWCWTSPTCSRRASCGLIAETVTLRPCASSVAVIPLAPHSLARTWRVVFGRSLKNGSIAPNCEHASSKFVPFGATSAHNCRSRRLLLHCAKVCGQAAPDAGPGRSSDGAAAASCPPPLRRSREPARQPSLQRFEVRSEAHYHHEPAN